MPRLQGTCASGSGYKKFRFQHMVFPHILAISYTRLTLATKMILMWTLKRAESQSQLLHTVSRKRGTKRGLWKADSESKGFKILSRCCQTVSRLLRQPCAGPFSKGGPMQLKSDNWCIRRLGSSAGYAGTSALHSKTSKGLRRCLKLLGNGPKPKARRRYLDKLYQSPLPRDLTAKRITAKRSHSQEISQPRESQHRDLTAKRSFKIWRKSRTKASLSHLQLSLLEGCLTRKLRFHIFSFQFLRELSHESFSMNFNINFSGSSIGSSSSNRSSSRSSSSRSSSRSSEAAVAAAAGLGVGNSSSS